MKIDEIKEINKVKQSNKGEVNKLPIYVISTGCYVIGRYNGILEIDTDNGKKEVIVFVAERGRLKQYNEMKRVKGDIYILCNNGLRRMIENEFQKKGDKYKLKPVDRRGKNIIIIHDGLNTINKGKDTYKLPIYVVREIK